MNENIPSQIEALKQFVANSDPAGRLGIVNERSVFLPSALSPADAPADATYKVIFKDASEQSVAFLLCANTLNPELVATNVNKAKTARNHLPELAATAIQIPIIEGNYNGLSWALFDILQPLSQRPWHWRLQKLRLTRPLVRWLTDVMKATRQAISGDDMATVAIAPLAAVADNKKFPKPFRLRAGRAIAEIESGRWLPQTTLAHNDLWKGNIMLPPTRTAGAPSPQFCIIDWAGSAVSGFAFFDLMKLARSFKFPMLYSRRIIKQHCAILDCTIDHSIDYLLLALGTLGLNLENFPAHVYTQMSVELIQDLSRITGDTK